MKVIIAAVLLFSITAFCREPKHRHHEAHSHGGATLNIAFDQLEGRAEFKGASAGIVGFEYIAKSAKDKKAVEYAVTRFEVGITKIIHFDDLLGCTFMKEKIEMVKEEENSDHSDFVANFKIKCAKPVFGSKLNLDFTKFPGLNDIDVTILIDDLQKTAEIKKKAVVVELK